MSKKRDFVVRFAVGDDKLGGSSSVWRVWKSRNNDDVYLAPRSAAGLVKGSLHASGQCHFAVTTQHHAAIRSGSRDRRITAWRRVPTPTDGYSNCVQILFASEFLSRTPFPIRQETTMLSYPQSGKAIVVDLLFSRIHGELSLMPLQQELGRLRLSTGETFLIIAGLVDDFDALAFQSAFFPLNETTTPGCTIEPPDAKRDDLRGAIILPDSGDGVLRIIEREIYACRAKGEHGGGLVQGERHLLRRSSKFVSFENLATRKEYQPTLARRDLAKGRGCRAIATGLNVHAPQAVEWLDHPLKGDWADHRECHIGGDCLLIYRLDGNQINFARSGAHAELFE